MKNEMNMPALPTKGALQSNICGEKTITCCKLSQDQSETPKPITLAVNDQDITTAVLPQRRTHYL
jgi:hypothetical protein